MHRVSKMGLFFSFLAIAGPLAAGLAGSPAGWRVAGDGAGFQVVP
jgi:hypothetical protein